MRERAELLGGELAVTERPGGGTVVELRAPLLERPQAAGRARILLVNDHAAIREAMAMAVGADGRFVVAAQAGTVARRDRPWRHRRGDHRPRPAGRRRQ